MCDNITTGSLDYTVALVLATWIQSALEHAPTISEDAQVAWNSLSACVKLASGQGLMLMWKAVYLQLYAWDSLDVVQRVLDVARSNKAVGKLDQSLSRCIVLRRYSVPYCYSVRSTKASIRSRISIVRNSRQVDTRWTCQRPSPTL